MNSILSYFNNLSVRKYLFNTSWLLVEQVLRIISSLFIGIWLARYLGPEQFGLLSYSMGYIAILTGVTKLGLDSIIVRELISNSNDKDAYLGTAFWLKLISAIFSILLLLFILPNNSFRDSNYLIIILSFTFIFQSFEVIEFYFQSQVYGKLTSICKISQLIIGSLIKIYLLVIKAKLVWFVILISFEAFLLAIVYFLAFKYNSSIRFLNKFNFNIAKQLLSDSWPLLFAGLGFTIFSNIDVIMIKRLLDDSSAGIYSAANKLSTVWYFIPGLVLNSIMPAIVGVKKNLFEFKKRTYFVTRMLVLFATTLAIITSIFSNEIIYFTFKNEFNGSTDILIVLVWINVLFFFNACWNFWLIIKNKTIYVLYSNLLIALLNVIFNIFFIPIFGALGAAYAIIISFLISMIILSFLDNDLRPLFYNSIGLGFLKP